MSIPINNLTKELAAFHEIMSNDVNENDSHQNGEAIIEISFADWLQEELNKRGWSQSELGRRAGLSRATISVLISGRSQPKAETCLALARALNLPAETVLKAADLLPELPAPGGDPTIGEIADMLKRMTAEERQEILAYVLWQFRRKRGG